MRFRILLVFGFVILGCIGLTAQIIRLNKVKGDNYTKRMLAQQSHTSNAIPYKRGDIVDTNGNKLATSVKVYNLFLGDLKGQEISSADEGCAGKCIWHFRQRC